MAHKKGVKRPRTRAEKIRELKRKLDLLRRSGGKRKLPGRPKKGNKG